MVEQRWRAADILRLGIGEGQQLVYTRATRTAQVMPRVQAALLASCQTFRTLDEHARAALSQLHPSDIAATRAQLQAFARDGLLVEEASLRTRCLAAPHRDAGPISISTVSVVTADRVASLERCLSSYIDNARSHQRTVQFRVMDDARTPDARTATQQMLGTLARDCGVAIAYAGADEKRALAAALTRDGEIPPDVIEFALFDPEGCGRSTGANHNAQLLYGAGRLFVSVDDDTTARLAATPGAKAGIALSSEYESQPTWFFADRARALESATFEDHDAIAIHEQLLGRTASACLRELDPASLVVDRLGAMLLRQIESGRGRVLVTQTGLVGDAASAYPPALSHLSGESFSRLVANEPDYREAMRSREVARGIAQLTITDNAALSTGPAIALDARELLPPFFPVQRNTDGIFGVTLRTTIEGGCIAHLPWTLEHAPADARIIPGDALTRFAGHSRLQDVVLASIHSVPAIAAGGGHDASARMTALGEHLRALGSLENQDFLTFLRPWVWRIKGSFIAALEEDLAAHDNQPVYWAADVRRFLESLREAMATDAYFIPEDLPSARNDEERMNLTRRLVRRFADLLVWWPAIFERARALQANGSRLVQRL
ncbi:MAG: hypothetical protein M3077_08645 [Candidatus Dormibacteraeota bacterium]|nr:hypothetical protein [Candidatus Dormibacteraeota bacterium]